MTNQLATVIPFPTKIGPVPCAEVRRQEVRELFRRRFPREALAAELAATANLLGWERIA